jgi:prevent-host-death family protein
MKLFNLHQAKAHLSSLVQKAASGEEIVLCKAGKPLARLIKYEQPITPRKPGLWKGKVVILEDFDTLPDNVLNAFKGKSP